MRIPTRLPAAAAAPVGVRGVSPTAALIGSGLAALVAGVGMILLRSTLEVRSVPERLLEWLLLFVPGWLLARKDGRR